MRGYEIKKINDNAYEVIVNGSTISTEKTAAEAEDFLLRLDVRRKDIIFNI